MEDVKVPKLPEIPKPDYWSAYNKTEGGRIGRIGDVLDQERHGHLVKSLLPRNTKADVREKRIAELRAESEREEAARLAIAHQVESLVTQINDRAQDETNLAYSESNAKLILEDLHQVLAVALAGRHHHPRQNIFAGQADTVQQIVACERIIAVTPGLREKNAAELKRLKQELAALTAEHNIKLN